MGAVMSFFGSELKKYQLLRERLLMDYPHVDSETLADTLEGITNLHEMIAAVVRSALVDEALQMGLRSRLDDMKTRLERFQTRAAKKRSLALEAMIEAGLTKLEQPDFTASTRAGLPSLIVTNERLVPHSYWLPQPPKLDRQLLAADIKRGAEVPGAELSNAAPVLAVRTK
jgi:hypothetical protein